MRHSPARSAWQARWTATSDDEQAVSIVRLGPCRPEQVRQPAGRDAVRDAGREVRVEQAAIAATRAAGRRSRCRSRRRRRRSPSARSRSGAWPACSSASQLTSSSSRCCGSMPCASRGAMPKNAGSKRSTSRRKPPRARRDAAGRLRIRIVRAHRRPSDPPAPAPIASTPSRSSRQKLAASSPPPGTRQPRPMIAIGSRAAASSRGQPRLRVFEREEGALQRRHARRHRAIAAGCGCSGRFMASPAARRAGVDVVVAHRRDGRRVEAFRPPRARAAVGGGRRGRRRDVALEQVRGDRLDRRVVEHQRRRQRRSQCRAPGRARCAAARPSANPCRGPSADRGAPVASSGIEAQHAHHRGRARRRAAGRAVPAGTVPARSRRSHSLLRIVAAWRGAARLASRRATPATDAAYCHASPRACARR